MVGRVADTYNYTIKKAMTLAHLITLTSVTENQMSAKTVAYTPEQTLELVSAYKETPTAETVNSFAVKFGKTVKSIVAKLSREGVYKKAEYMTKTGETPISKETLATEIGEFFGMDDGNASSLAKANKKALQTLKAATKELAELREFKAFAMQFIPKTTPETETEITPETETEITPETNPE
jgi:hypothetical protein